MVQATGKDRFNELVDAYLETEQRIAVTKCYMKFPEADKEATKRHAKVKTYDLLFRAVKSWANYLSK